MHRRPRVSVLIPRMIHPALSGGELRVRSLLEALSPRWRVTLFAPLTPASAAAQTAAALALERRADVRVRLVAPARRAAPASANLPAIAPEHLDENLVHEVRAEAARAGTDLIHLEFTQMAQYAPRLRDLAPVVATEHDAGVIARGLSYLRPSPSEPAPARYAAYLRRHLTACARVIAVTADDARRLRRVAPAGHLRVVCQGVDLDSFPFRGPEGRRPGAVSFVGHYRHYPNEDAAVRLARGILPRLRRLVPEASLALIGSAPTPAVEALRSAIVSVTGAVPEIAPELARSSVFLAPLRLGCGMKSKILEALAAGTPVVASPRACEGIAGLAHGRHLLIARDDADFATKAARVLRDAPLAARLTRAGRALVERRYTWRAQAARQDRVWREALETVR